MPDASRIKWYALLLSLPFVLLLHLNTHLELERYQHHKLLEIADDHRVPSSAEVKAVSLNYHTASADLLWISNLLYAVERRIRRVPRRAVTQYADAIIDLDPYLRPVYMWHNAFRYHSSAHPEVDDLTETNRILKRGLEYYPDDWLMARAIVINHIDHRFELSRQERIAGLEEAVQYAELGANMEGAPPEMTGLAINFRHRLERVRQGLPERGEPLDDSVQASPSELDFLFRRYFAADDESQQRFLRRQLIRMGAEEALLNQLGLYENQFRELHGKRYGYLSPDLFVLVDAELYLWHDSGAPQSPPIN